MSSIINRSLRISYVAAVFVVSCQSLREPDLGVTTPIAESKPSRDYSIQIGDEVDVFVIEDTSFNGTFNVRPSGDIIMPKVGRIPLQGLTLTAAELRIQSALQANQLRQATVIVDPGSRGAVGGGLTVRISGEVGKTGRTTLQALGNAPISAYQAIVESGGFKIFADKKRSYILRNAPEGVRRIDVNFVAVEAGKSIDPPLVEGDCLVVPRKGFGF